jgi:soluble lytic murein transglycosylase-like protein
LAIMPEPESHPELISESEPMIATESGLSPDRTLPIYEVFKNGHRVNVSAEHQWLIRDMAAEYGFCERWIFGLILAESTFNPKAGEGGRHPGWCQVSPYWLSSRATQGGVPRFTDDYRTRSLTDPHDNLLTCMEIWTFAVRTYNLDLTTDLGYHRLAYWHNTGRPPNNVSNWAYSHRIVRFANELVEIQY